MDSFGPYAVVPALKQYEDPSSTEAMREFAQTVILSLQNTEEIFDKVVEAVRHGRYFPLPSKTTSVAELMGAMNTWWWIVIEAKYQSNKAFVEYVARRHLRNPQGQEHIIDLLARTNFIMAASHLAELEFNSLAESSLEALKLHLNPPSQLQGKTDSALVARMSVFSFMFTRLDKSRREALGLLYTIEKYPASFQEVFVPTSFQYFTGKEKEIALHHCSKLPRATRSAIYNQIRPYCDLKLLKTLEFYERQ
jgi:hypothetical protein